MADIGRATSPYKVKEKTKEDFVQVHDFIKNEAYEVAMAAEP